MDITDLIKKLYGVLPEAAVEPVEAIVEIGGQSIPFLSGAVNWYKFNNINKELTHLSRQINTITDKLILSDNEVFIKQEVFPIILNKILNDEQSEKISVMLNGFEHIIDENILDTDKIFHYYDVLSEMRLSEIVHLTEGYVKPMENARNPYKIKLNPLRINIQKTEEEKERADLERYMDNKLHRLGILQYAKEQTRNRNYRPQDYKDLGSNKKDYKVNIERFEISNFGLRFIEFFYKEDTAE
ncbi:hypothetical protein FHE72_15260 [Rossellomorea vietnamensis]|uniref:Uncharacterized protein n=1 Tax=Rossellomorea vietnamensis TaxID=218284 RepID=A0A6I6UTF7_9BACI|nr:hypothetical protein [Rossellomorea vietnamensis]QHE62222.1 hypothetical protein FHE72_15260 [Rossellomorea vietnamensis]QWC21720.1 hypothetical protein KJK41_15550 [Bacillus haikouensis]